MTGGIRRVSRRRWLGGAAGALLVLGPFTARGQEGVFLSPDDAPRALFPAATAVRAQSIPSTAPLRARIREILGRPPSLWEAAYVVATADGATGPLGHVVVVEEIGKHHPITFAVAVRPDGSVHDVAVLAYREPYGGEVRERRFLRQYAGRTLRDPLAAYRDIQNISGATLSVEATGRAVRKAIAVIAAAGLLR